VYLCGGCLLLAGICWLKAQAASQKLAASATPMPSSMMQPGVTPASLGPTASLSLMQVMEQVPDLVSDMHLAG
jgi:hypothetical protein